MAIELNFTETTARGAVMHREFIVTRDGLPVPGVLWESDSTAPGAPMVLFGHGASGDRHQAPIPRIAGALARRGIFGLAIDGPVHGLRKVGDGGRGAFGEVTRSESMVDEILADWRAALGAMQSLPEVGTGKLGYFGLSMGTILGTPVVAAMDMSVAVLGLMGTISPTERYGEQLRDAASRIHCPLFFIMQLEDELFARDRCLDLFDRIASRDKRLHANPGLHPEVPVEEVDFATEFLAGRLLGEASGRVTSPIAE
tara:strand:+ start:268 stop:1035 length:768 start_codon:yes stop_codon:yes gene_type:complete